MNDKLTITIDVSKVDKTKITERRYNDKAGHEFIAKELKLDVVPLKEAKMLKEGDGWQMWKTHFVAIPQSKEERENKVKSIIVGDGLMFKTKVEAPKEATIQTKPPVDDVNPNDIPF